MKTYFMDNKILGNFDSAEFCLSGKEKKKEID